MDRRTHYQGKNLAFLLLAICAPGGLLYLRIALQFAAVRAPWLAGLATACLVLFFIAQAAGGWYLRRLLPPARTAWGSALQYSALFVAGIFLSITGAVMLEAFGYTLWLRLGRH